MAVFPYFNQAFTFAISSSLRTLLSNLPTEDFGKSASISTSFGALYGASLSLAIIQAGCLRQNT